jgi:hypothetical protein
VRATNVNYGKLIEVLCEFLRGNLREVALCVDLLPEALAFVIECGSVNVVFGFDEVETLLLPGVDPAFQVRDSVVAESFNPRRIGGGSLFSVITEHDLGLLVRDEGW